jgi:hypothetical protein
MRALFVAALCISLLFYPGKAFAESEEICCNWVNIKYVSDSKPQKLILNYDGTFATYNTRHQLRPLNKEYFK